MQYTSRHRLRPNHSRLRSVATQVFRPLRQASQHGSRTRKAKVERKRLCAIINDSICREFISLFRESMPSNGNDHYLERPLYWNEATLFRKKQKSSFSTRCPSNDCMCSSIATETSTLEPTFRSKTTVGCRSNLVHEPFWSISTRPRLCF